MFGHFLSKLLSQPWSGRLDSNQCSPAPKAGGKNLTSLLPDINKKPDQFFDRAACYSM